MAAKPTPLDEYWAQVADVIAWAQDRPADPVDDPAAEPVAA